MTRDEKILRTAAIEAQIWGAAYAAWLPNAIESCGSRSEGHGEAMVWADEATSSFLSGLDLPSAASLIEQSEVDQ